MSVPSQCIPLYRYHALFLIAVLILHKIMHPLISHHIPISAQILMSVGSIRSGCSAATNLEVHKGDRDLFDYCTFGMETDCLGKHSLRNRSQPEESIKTDTQSSITKYVTNRFRSLKKPLMLFVSSRRTSCSRC